MKNLFQTSMVISIASLVVPNAFAQSNDDPHFYGGIAYERIAVDSNPDVKFNSVLLRGGYRFSKYFGAEAEAGVGLGSDTVNLGPAGGTSVPVKFKTGLTAAVYGVGFLPLSDNFDLIGRVGYKYLDMKAKTAGFESQAKDSGFAYSVGAQYYFTDKHGIRVDYQRTGNDVATYTLGYTVRF